jgi:hypothetical protein
MQKFNCGCGRAVRDVYYKNGEYMCGKCFWQINDNPYDYLINMLAAKGLVITFKNTPVLILKQFNADFIGDREMVTQPDETWFWLSGDDFWQSYNGQPDQLRNYISAYSVKKEEGGCNHKEE